MTEIKPRNFGVYRQNGEERSPRYGYKKLACLPVNKPISTASFTILFSSVYFCTILTPETPQKMMITLSVIVYGPGFAI